MPARAAIARAVAPAGSPRSARIHSGSAQPVIAPSVAAGTTPERRSDSRPAATPITNGTNQRPGAAVAATTTVTTAKTARRLTIERPLHVVADRARFRDRQVLPV